MSRARTTVFGVISACIASLAAGGASAQHSVARAWDDTMLESIKRDRVRPPVQARNLFHLSVAMYDAWAAYDPAVRPYFFGEKISAKDVEAARHESISYAAYRLMKHRFALSPNVAAINTILDARLTALGYAPATRPLRSATASRRWSSSADSQTTPTRRSTTRRIPGPTPT